MIYDDAHQIPPDFLATCRPMPWPHRILMCPPDEFDVVDVKNPHMAEHVGAVDRKLAREQWDGVVAAFESCGAQVEFIDPLPGREDMVFCANQTLVGLNERGRVRVVLGRMKHPSRQQEVPAFERWARERNYEVVELPPGPGFEGGGDAIWHPGRGLLWGGHGHRTDPTAYEAVASAFGVPVLRLHLRSDHFYHLDTSLCTLDERTVLIHPGAFDDRGLELIGRVFERVIESPPEEAEGGLAVNATALGGRDVVIQSGNPITVGRLSEAGFSVVEVDTSEFLKSGGSVYCLKMLLF